MKPTLSVVAAACCLMVAQSANAADAPVKSYAIPSWGDYTIVYGPGTDPSMGTPAEMENMFRMWKARGYNGVFLRSDLQQIEPFVIRNPRKQMNAGLALLWQYIDVQSEKADYFQSAQQAADKVGFEFWVYHPHIYSQGAPVDVGTPGWGRMIPWSYVSRLQHDHPEVVSIDRKGNKYWMVPEYAYPIARKMFVDEYVYMAKKYGIKNFIISMRSEVNQVIDPTDKADRFGFNQPVVDDMKRLYGVDIMTDPRFDVDSPTFNNLDPMVEKWHDLRGSYLTQMFRDLRQALNAVDPKIKIGIHWAGDRVGVPLGNWKTDWRTWIDEGLVDRFVGPVSFEATHDADADKKGYLTNIRAGVGAVSFTTLHDYIKASRHPHIDVISTGGPPYFDAKPQAGADGWQRDVWYSSYHLAWYQRWQQLLRDVKQRGSIRFLEQNFDTVSPNAVAGESGAWGLHAYDPKLRACPGAWWRIGDGKSARPFAQSAVRRGNKGQAIQLTNAADGSGTLTGWHMSFPDRAQLTNAIDVSITNGFTNFSFWVMRKSTESGLSVYLQGDKSETDIGLNIAANSGIVSYSVDKNSKWAATSQTVPVGKWCRLTIQVDLDKKVYGATVGDSKPALVCRDVTFTVPTERIIQQNGVNVDIRVPAFREFKQVFFKPEGEVGSTSYLDDVSVRWKPTLFFAPQGSRTELAENFEAYKPGTAWGPAGVTPKLPLRTVALEKGSFVTNEMSYGSGVNALYVHAGDKVSPKPAAKLKLNAPLTLDFDVFISSESSFPYLIPFTTTRSPHRATIGLAKADGSPVASVMAGDGTWQYWNGNAWADSGQKIHYDAWNHLQLALDGKGGYQVVVQPEGQVPSLAAKGRTGAMGGRDTAALTIEASGEKYSVYDNLVVTSGRPAR